MGASLGAATAEAAAAGVAAAGAAAVGAAAAGVVTTVAVVQGEGVHKKTATVVHCTYPMRKLVVFTFYSQKRPCVVASPKLPPCPCIRY